MMPERGTRSSQRQRTRRDLLEAAGRLAKQGKKPTLDEVAAEALVSRATAYRYFPNIEALWTEAALHVAFPDPGELFDADESTDPIERLQKADLAIDRMIEENESALRVMLAQSLERSLGGDVPLNRQNRRSLLIDAALDPLRAHFSPPEYKRLKQGLALLMATEATIVFKDVLQLSSDEARQVRHWAMTAMVAAARKKAD